MASRSERDDAGTRVGGRMSFVSRKAPLRYAFVGGAPAHLNGWGMSMDTFLPSTSTFL